MKSATKGMKCKINYGPGCCPTFTAGGRKRVVTPDDGCGTRVVAVNAEVVSKDGTRWHGVLEIDETSSGELCGIMVFTPDGLRSTSDEDFESAIGLARDDFFPMKYRYLAALDCYDHHVGEDGWSL